MVQIGHRGASGFAPENTLIAFEKALALGCSGIELDVQQTRDGHLVVFHDWMLERTSTGSGLLRDHSLAELQQLDAGSWFSDDFKACRIPTLEQVFEMLPSDCFINVEIKELFSAERGTEHLLATLIQQYKLWDRIITSSFSHNLIANLAQEQPHAKLGLLSATNNFSALLAGINYHPYSYHPAVWVLSQQEVLLAQERGIKVYPWTVNHAYEFQQCQTLEVDGIITNYPKKFKHS